nr:MAG TPA_asm: hypothetical protein [Caudoviricetes sp.]
MLVAGGVSIEYRQNQQCCSMVRSGGAVPP